MYVLVHEILQISSIPGTGYLALLWLARQNDSMKTALPPFPQAAGSAGYGLGIFLMGLCSDRFGRRQTILVCCLVTAVSHLLAPLVPDILAYSILYFFMHFGASGE
jgi:MFS family permease